ncbi:MULTISPECIES: hypothetical protein [unclassified Arthrobacter]|uniref:hypothetical protein n=1 Tax=unclassified Arthrobacter TaxID=235627 RepID=UPI001D1396B2|nr:MULTISPECIES: hypothetical protein [unclassified Arthrobacter]MCC3275406.1 hypothetical protein [Arthrobacter sp. zg-Y20]MCC9176852.1 hypothetical protein [Arthrobacter sp. zg-Y750]MDK1315565.1 hypothetical protein [Arthrobacter sp. zg.Y20]WIB05980.1 hypothetical protein QNO06_15900 [Arthrobacter sp. zg-Y20]
MRASRTFNIVYAVALILVGAALLAAWLLLDMASLWEGFCLGAGITLLAAGIYVAVAFVWKGSTDASGTEYWLPSRDTGGSAGPLPGPKGGGQP